MPKASQNKSECVGRGGKAKGAEGAQIASTRGEAEGTAGGGTTEGGLEAHARS